MKRHEILIFYEERWKDLKLPPLGNLVLRVRHFLSSEEGGIVKLKTVIPVCSVVLFALLLSYGLFRHELWGDELQAWMIARESHSLGELFQNTAYEGHPVLWHLMLWIVTRFSLAPVYMQLLHGLIAIGSVFIVSFFAPFRREQKILLIFSYFVFYEYAIISRCYGLGIFLSFLFCALSAHERNQAYPTKAIFFDYKLWARMLILVALANTSAYGFILSVALSLTFLDGHVGLRAILMSRPKTLFFLSSVLLIGWLLSGWQIVRAFRLESMRQIIKADSLMMQPPLLETAPSPNNFPLASLNLSIDAEHLLRISRLLAYVWKSYIPIPEMNGVDFWNTSLFSENAIGLLKLSVPGLGGANLGQMLAVLLSVFLLSYIPLYCLRKPVVKATYCLGNAALLLLTYLLMPTAIRHYGHFFILFVICAWLDATPLSLESLATRDLQASKKIFRRRTASILTLVFFVQSCVGAYAYTLDCLYPFSGGRDASRFIKQQKLENLSIVASPPWPTSVFSGYLNKDVYYIDLQRYGSFITPEKGNENYEAAVAEVRHLLFAEGRIVVAFDLEQSIEDLALALREGKSDSRIFNFEASFLGKFEGKLEPSDSYRVYTLELT